jgi:tetratricopeptide (TPR) repeat protein
MMSPRPLATLGLIALAQLWAAPVRAACHLETLAVLPVTMKGMEPTVPVKVNGHDAQFLVDSGAFFTGLSPQAAARFGVATRFEGANVQGVGGAEEVKTAVVDTFTIGGLPLRQMEVTVFASAGEGTLGRNVLGRNDVEYDLANGVVRLVKTVDCKSTDNLAYWSKDPQIMGIDLTSRQYEAIIGAGAINGQKIRIQFDTGASYTTVTLDAAARAGVTPSSPGAKPAGKTVGIGPKAIDTWIAPVASFSVGTEEILHTNLRIGDIALGDVDMLLGADFFLSHRVLIAHSQHRVYFTYNGGPVFRLERAAAAGLSARQSAATAPEAAQSDPNLPTDAAGFARRASAAAARLEYPQAIADFSKSIDLDPHVAQTWFARGQAYLANRQPRYALADFDQTLRLKPDDAAALMARAGLTINSNRTQAQADLAAAASASTDPEQSLQIALMFERAGLLPEGVTQLDRWLAANPGAAPAQRAAALNGRCWLRAVLNQGLDQALADCDAALRLRPRTAAFLDSRGHVRLNRGQYDLAIADYDAALQENPKLAAAMYGRGVAKARKGAKAEGEADLKAALAINPRLAQRAPRIGLPAPAELGLTPPPPPPGDDSQG